MGLCTSSSSQVALGASSAPFMLSFTAVPYEVTILENQVLILLNILDGKKNIE
jgi:hypothetical protein